MDTLSQQDFGFIQGLVQRRSAIVLEPEKAYLIETRLTPLARQNGFASLKAFIATLRVNASVDLQHRVVEAITTHETSFFRDAHPFETLKTSVLPEMIAKRAPGQGLTIWCAACSSGQEPFSVAMLVHEHFPNLLRGRLRIVATDLSGAILARARDGVYSQTEISRGLPVATLARYFDQQGMGWRIKSEIRRMVDFQQSNLAAAWPVLPPQDIIFMRNVLIYFGIDTKKAILAKVRGMLKPDGYLFLGSSETTLNLDAAFEPVTKGKTICYRLRKPESARLEAI